MIQTTLCYLGNNQQYLLLHRTKKQNDVNKDKWIGIGGKFEEGESPEDCLLREVKEETGLALLSYKYCGIITFVSNNCPTEHMHLFTADKWEGTPIECDEGELAWIDKKDFLKLPMWEGDKIFLDLMEQNIPFFSLKLVYQDDKLTSAVLNGEKIH